MSTYDLALTENLTEEDMLQFLKERYESEKFYTFAGDVLLSFSSKKKCGQSELREYRLQKNSTSSPLAEPAHLFSFLSKIYRQATNDSSSHTLFLSGETQAGKSTVATQSTLFLASIQPEIENQWECVHVLLNGIGSTPTAEGPSTRYAEHRKIFFDSNGFPVGGSLTLFGLELPRVSLLARSEPNFNIFYFLLEGLDDDERDELHLHRDTTFTYLTPMENDDTISTQENFQNFKTALRFIVREGEECHHVFRIWSAILHLGNIHLVLKSPGFVAIKDKAEVKICAELLGIDAKTLERFILDKDPNLEACQRLIDELAMSLYSAVATWLVQKINLSLQKQNESTDEQATVGILDVTGYDPRRMEQNSSDFFVNILNEKMTQLFCYQVQKNIGVNLKYSTICTDLLMNILHLLSDPERPTGNDLLQQFQKTTQNSPFAEIKRNASAHCLEINHFFRNISYNIEDLCQFTAPCDMRSRDHLHSITTTAAGALGAALPPLGESAPTNALYIHGGVELLEAILDDTQVHFLGCIRTSTNAEHFDEEEVLRQLKTMGIIRLVNHRKGKRVIISELEELPLSPRSQSLNTLGDLDPKHKGQSKRDQNKNSGSQISPRSRKKKLKGILARSSSDHATNAIAAKATTTASTGAERRTLRSIGRKVSAGVRGQNKKHEISPSAHEAHESISPRSLAPPESIPRSNSHFEIASKTKPPKLPISSRLKRSGDRVGPLRSPRQYGALNYSDPVVHQSGDDSSEDSLVLSSDDLSSISELSSEEEKEAVPPVDRRAVFIRSKENQAWKTSMAALPSRVVREADKLLRSSSRSFDRMSIMRGQVTSGTEAKKRKEEFLFLYSCGSLLRTLYQKSDPVADQILSPHRQGTAPVPARSRSKSDWRRNRAVSATDSDHRHMIVQMGPGKSMTDSATSSTLLEEWKNVEDVEKTAEDVNWERKSLKLRKKQSIIPLLKLHSGDTVVNQISYNNPIRMTPRRQKAIITFIDAQAHDFLSYAMDRFSLPDKLAKKASNSTKFKAKMKKYISATKTPINSPLHPLRHPLDITAVDNFKHIYLYMLSKPGENTSASSMEHIRCIVENGLRKSTLRDEIYCQLVKQLTNNPKEKWTMLVWELVAICSGCFAPCYFLKTFTRFLDEEMMNPGPTGAWASYCKDRMAKVSDRGKRLFVPVEKELKAVQLRKPLMEVFHFMDGKQKQIPVYSSTTAAEALEFLLQMVGLVSAEGYMIYEEYQIRDARTNELEITERSLLNSEVICTSLSKFQIFENSFSDSNDFTVQARFVVKRKLFVDNAATSAAESKLLFHQLSQSIQNGDLLINESDALLLNGLQLQVRFGNHTDSVDFSPKDFVPRDVYGHHSVREWKKLLTERHHELVGVSTDDARTAFLDICKQLPFYGFHLFHVSTGQTQGGWKLPQKFLLGISENGLFCLNASKEIYHSFAFLDILYYSSTASAVELTLADGRSITANTNKGEEVISLIIDYKFHQLSKEDEVCK